MKVEFSPLTAALIPACREFNNRLRRHGEPLFALPEEAPPERLASPDGIKWTHYVAVDEGGAVRGGVLLMEQRGWLGQRVIPLLNVQSPLSEGTVDRAYSGVGLRMLQFLMRRNPHVYAVGMGSEQNSFARLLVAAGWPVARVPFQFAVIHAARCLREIQPLRHGSKRIFARGLAASGLGDAATAAWRLTHRRPSLRGYSFETATLWPTDLDTIWDRCRSDFDFSVVRDAGGVADLHPVTQGRLQKYLLRKSGEIVGWSVGLVTAMNSNPHFGDLRVGTILDALAPPEHLDALFTHTYDSLCELGADLIVSNQAHERWQSALGRLGFLSGPSNYLMALSKPLTSALKPEPGTPSRVYLSRADGDGRVNL
jgi:hypothetical protein